MSKNLLFVAAAVVVTLFTTSAVAQGTSRRFSDPMTYDQMRRLLSPLQLSDAQHDVADAAHERYLAALLELRHGRVGVFLDRYGSTPLAFMDDRESIVAAGRERRAIQAEIGRVERQFFAGLRPALSEDQAGQLTRMAERRERKRLSGGSVMPMFGWSLPRLARLDLVPYVDQLELDPAVRRKIDPALETYESSLTPMYRAVAEHRRGLPLAHFDRTIETRRAIEDRLEQDLDEDASAAAGVVGDAFHGGPGRSSSELKEMTAIRDQIVRISRLNRRLVDEIRPIIGAEAAAELEGRYVRRALSSVGAPRDPLAKRVEKLLESDADDEIKAAVRALYDGFVPDRRRLVWRLVAAAEEEAFRRNRAGAADGGETDIQKSRTAIRELDGEALEQYAALTGETIEAPKSSRFLETLETVGNDDNVSIEISDDAVQGVVTVMADALVPEASVAIELHGPDGGEEMIGSFATIVFDAPDADAGGLILGDFAEPMPIMVHAVGWSMPGRRGWLPGAMTRDSIGHLSKALELDEPMNAVLDSLYDDYLATFAELDAQILAPAREQIGTPAKADQIDDVYGGIRAAMDSILALDRRFFDDVWALRGAEGEAAIARAMRARTRDAHGRSGGRMFMMHGESSREHDTDLLAVARAAVTDLDEDLEPLTAHDHASAPLVTQRWYARLDEAAAEARKHADRAESGDHPHPVPFEPFAQARQPSGQLDTQIRALNRSTLASLASAMGAADFHAVREAYQRKAFPSIYRDRSKLDDLLARAQALTLDAATKRRVDELCLAHRGEYDSICDRMIDKTRAFEARAAAEKPSEDAPHGFERQQQLRQELSADRFERTNLNQRTRQTLIDLLDGDSRATLGLTTPDQP